MSEVEKPEKTDVAKKFKVIQPPDTLKDKVSITADGVDLETLEKAEQLIAGMQGSYLEWVEEDLKKVSDLYELAVQNEADRATVFEDLFSVAHDIKGQGGSFNYPLMTMIGNLLCRFLERCKDHPKESHLAVIRVHIDALRLVISKRMEGDGGRAGENLVQGLNATIGKTLANDEAEG